MYASLNPGMLGVQADLAGTVVLAQRFGFPGADFSIVEAAALAQAQGVDAVAELFTRHGVRPGPWGIPVEFRQDETAWRAGLALLPSLAAVAAALGADRTATWIMPCDDERDFAANFRFHVSRLTPIAQILGEHGIRFGLEFVGPATLRRTRRHPFIHTLDGMLALAAAVGENVGLLLDSFHLYTAHGALADVRALPNSAIVTVHVNDAIAGFGPDEQIDQVRALPGETGVLDLAGFVDALRAIGYDGPVTTEPFSQRVRALPAAEAVGETAAAMRGIGVLN